jgi:hypothetical protein
MYYIIAKDIQGIFKNKYFAKFSVYKNKGCVGS